VSGANAPLAGVRNFTVRVASSAVIAIATRSSGDMESRVVEIPPRSSVRDAAPGASSGSMMVFARPSVVRRAAIANTAGARYENLVASERNKASCSSFTEQTLRRDYGATRALCWAG